MSARERILPVFVPHLGCPHRCVFCNQQRISGQQRAATADTVREAVEQASSAEGGLQLAFYGGSFTAIPAAEQESLLACAKEYRESGKIASVRLSTRPDAIDEEVIARLRRYGVETVELGAQSMDEAVLCASERGHTASDVEKAAGLLRENGFRVILQMMTGLPGDTKEKSIETARRLIALKPDGVRIYPTVIVRDTPLYASYLRGEYREHSVEEAVDWCAELLPLFESAGIPVIRLGLNPTEELSSGAAAAGAYHPALGELVKSRILRNRAEELLAGIPAGSSVTLGCASSRLSQLIGQKRANVAYLSEKFSLSELRIRSTDAKNGEIRVLSR